MPNNDDNLVSRGVTGGVSGDAKPPAADAKPEEKAVATAPPPPSYDDDPLAEDESDMTSIMDLGQRRVLQQAARSGDAALVKQAAERIAAEREGKTDAVTVPPPPEAGAAAGANEGENKSTAPPPAEAGAAGALPAKIPDAGIPAEAKAADHEKITKPMKAEPSLAAPEEKPKAAALAPAPAQRGGINPWLVATAVAAVLFVLTLLLALRTP